MTRLHSSLTVLSPDEIEKNHRASVRVLERTGVKMPRPDCLKICEQAGALVVIESAMFRIPSRVMEAALEEIRKASRPVPPHSKCARGRAGSESSRI